MTTLAEARALVQRGREAGISCPCCDQLAKTYHRALRATMAYALILVHRESKSTSNAWIHAPKFLNERGANAANDFALLRHWGLIEERPGVRNDGSTRVGFYRMTVKGSRFCESLELVPRCVVLYNQDVLGFTGREISVGDALGTRFNYDALMAGV